MTLTRGELMQAAAGYGAQVSKTITFDGTDGAGKILTAATATVTIDGVDDGDTVTIGSVTYTFQTVLVDTPNNVLIGASDAAALDNLKSAINASAGEGTTYGTGTVAHPTVNATTNTDTTQVVAADTSGSAGNSIAVSASDASLTWGTATLTGGADGTIDLFTVTGTVAMKVLAVCSTNLAGASATLEVGTALSSTGLIALTTATDIDANEIWHDNSPDASIEATTVLAEKIVSDDVIATPRTAGVSGGVISFTCIWKPLSVDGNVEAA